MIEELQIGALGTLLVVVIGTLTSTAIGVTVGGLAGIQRLFSGFVLARLTEVLGGIPSPILLALLAARAGGLDPTTFALAVGVFRSADLARLLQTEIWRLRGSGHVEASHSLGAGESWILRHHFLPELAPHLVAHGLVTAASAIAVDAALGVAGLSLGQKTLTWGGALALTRPGQGLPVVPAIASVLAIGAFVVLARLLQRRLQLPLDHVAE